MGRDRERKTGNIGAFPQLSPRGLTRWQAAAYVGVGTTKFDEMVGDGRMPQPKEIDKQRVWDRYQLDQAFEALGEDRQDDEIAAARRQWDED